jgi:hypothetical protein
VVRCLQRGRVAPGVEARGAVQERVLQNRDGWERTWVVTSVF